MKKTASFLIIFVLLSLGVGCKKQEIKFPDRQAHTNVSSALTYDEYNKQEEKEKAERINKIKNAEWRKNPENYKLIALTFDDGPNYKYAKGNNTTAIIDALNKYEGAGTIFVRGDNVEINGTALLQYAVDGGFELANHTYSHPYLDSLSKDKIREQIEKTNDIIYERMNIKLRYIRPGYGNVNENVFAVTKELNMVPIWTTDELKSKDYDDLSTPESVANTVVNMAYDGAIVILHCWPDNTAGAIDDMCKRLYEKGYRFVTLSEMFQYKGIKNLPTDRYVYSARDLK